MHPSWVQQDNISSQAFTTTSQAFKPSLKDESKLSVYNGEKLTAESSYQHFVQDGKKSAGVLAVTPDECTQNNLTSFEDNDPFDGHSVICFDGSLLSFIDFYFPFVLSSILALVILSRRPPSFSQ